MKFTVFALSASLLACSSGSPIRMTDQVDQMDHHAANITSSNTNSNSDPSNLLASRNHMNNMQAAKESHMHKVGTNMHSRRMIESPGSMEAMQTMNCRMKGDAIIECERLVASPQPSSTTHEERMMADRMIGSKDITGEKTATGTKAMMGAGDVGNAASGMHVRSMMDSTNVMDSNAMERAGRMNIFDADSMHMSNEAVSQNH
ncbi:hypothetical protein DPSP01_008824 [Paraphaeosphaeria sporulosa]